MLKRKLIATSVALAAVYTCATQMKAQTPADPSVPPATKDSYSTPRQILAPPDLVGPTISVIVDPSLQLDANTAAIYQQAAGVLNGSTIAPNDRTNYYSAFTNSQTESINGWSAFVENVQPNCQGYLVTISVAPSMSSTNAGAVAIVVGANYFEQYQVTNGQATYVGFSDPDGTSGQAFGLIGL